MLRSFAATLYPSIPVAYRSDYPVEEAVKRLREAVKPTIFHSLFKQSAVGEVRKDRVRLQKVIPFFGNSFKPIFVGAFKDTADGVILEGVFTTFMFSKIVMTVWFGFSLIWTLTAIFAAAGIIFAKGNILTSFNMLYAISFPVFGLLFMAFGYGLLRFCWWVSRADMDFLSRTITHALTK